MSGLPIDVSVPDQPTPFDVPTMNHIARRKLGELVADGHDVCGLMIQRQNADGTVTRGAVSAGGMVIWWNPEELDAMRQEHAAIQKWVDDGKAIFDAAKTSTLFRVGMWWADRPWRQKGQS